MMRVLIALVVLFLYQRTARSYHFQDVHFNNVLMTEWDDMNEPMLIRTRRAVYQHTHTKTRSEVVQCSRHVQAACCGGEHIFNMHTNVKDKNKKCLSKITGSTNFEEERIDYFNCTQMMELRDRTTCMKECVGKELGILDSDGNLVSDALSKFMMTTVSSDTWKRNLAQEAIRTCIKNSNKFERNIEKEVSSDCNPAALDFLYCAWAETQLNCPSNRRVSGKHCDEIRKKLEKYRKPDI